VRTLNKKIWPVCVRVTLNPKIHQDISDWLEQTIGDLDNVYLVWRGDGVWDYYFRSEELATLFSLRWS